MRKDKMTIQQAQKRQEEILAQFSLNEQKLIGEAMEIEYQFALYEKGHKSDIDDDVSS